jgi:hypothetical protein
MGALLPILGKAAATTAATTVPASMAGTYFAGASGATAGLANALNAGITAGSALGGGGSLAGLTPGIFAKAAPALGGLQSLTPTLATKAGPGLFNTMGMNPLAGMQSVLPSASKVAPNLVGQNAPLTVNPFSAINQATGMGNFGTQAGNLAPEFVKTYTTTPGASTAVFDPSKGLLGNVPKAPPTVSSVSKAATSPFTEATNKSVLDAIQVSKEVPRVLPAPSQPLSALQADAGFATNFMNLMKNPSLKGAAEYVEKHPVASAGAAYGLYNLAKGKPKGPEKDVALIRPYDFDYNPNAEAYATSPTTDSSERLYFSPTFTAQTPYEAPGPEYKRAAEGGVMGLAVGGPVETMSAMNAIGGNMQYPQAGLHTALYSNPMMQRPESVNVISPGEGPAVGAYSGEQKFAMGGLSDLGGYSDGGRLLKGPGDGVSDSIPAVIGNRQPARLADGEFVIPARIVSEIGNGSTEAGARKLYAMMDRVQKARRKTVGKGKVAANTKADKYLPA